MRPMKIGLKISKTLTLGSALHPADGPRPVIPAERQSPAGTQAREVQLLLVTSKFLNHVSSWMEIAENGSKDLQHE